MTHLERRQKQHPDTEYFHLYNANPKGKFTEDCVVRAISTVLEKSYEEVVMELAQMQCKSGVCAFGNTGINKYMKQNGWISVTQPRKHNNTKYSGVEFCRTLMDPTRCDELNLPKCNVHKILANIGSQHTVAIIDGKIYDTWNSSYDKIGKIWVKLV